MLKLVFCVKRLPHLSRTEFQRYWRETHGPLVRSHAAALGVVRYVQLHTGHDALNDGLQASRGGPEAYDGVAEMWWDSADALAAATASPAGRAASVALLEDERRFIDLAASPLFVGEEHEIIAGAR